MNTFYTLDGKLYKLSSDKHINLIKSFLDENYLFLESTDTSKSTNIVYSKELLYHYLKNNVIIGMLNNDGKGDLIGVISGKVIKIIEQEVEKNVVEVNFLSVSNKHRGLGIAKILRENLKRFFKIKTAYYTTSYPLKNPAFCIASIKHFNIKRNCDKYKDKVVKLDKMKKGDISSVELLLSKNKYHISIKLDKNFLDDLIKSPIKCYVSRKGSNITGFVSFYETVKKTGGVITDVICNLYYYSDLSTLYECLILICNNYPKFTDIQCCIIGNNCHYKLSEWGFNPGTGIMYYNMFKVDNHRFVPNFYNPEDVNLLMI